MSGRVPEHTVRFPATTQRWELLTFLHWPFRVRDVQALVPPRLRVQEWEGRTWVGVTPFRMADVRVAARPAPVAWRSFAELNVRIYVQGPDGRDGIWFPLLLAVPPSFVGTMRAVGIPYRRTAARTAAEGPRWSYRFAVPRAGPWRGHVDFRADVEVGPAVRGSERTSLVDSLTGRWLAYHPRGAGSWRIPVQHEPWSLSEATARGALTGPLLAVGLPPPQEAPVVHAAGAVHARLGLPRPTRASRGDAPGCEPGGPG